MNKLKFWVISLISLLNLIGFSFFVWKSNLIGITLFIGNFSSIYDIGGMFWYFIIFSLYMFLVDYLVIVVVYKFNGYEGKNSRLFIYSLLFFVFYTITFQFLIIFLEGVVLFTFFLIFSLVMPFLLLRIYSPQKNILSQDFSNEVNSGINIRIHPSIDIFFRASISSVLASFYITTFFHFLFVGADFGQGAGLGSVIDGLSVLGFSLFFTLIFGYLIMLWISKTREYNYKNAILFLLTLILIFLPLGFTYWLAFNHENGDLLEAIKLVIGAVIIAIIVSIIPTISSFIIFLKTRNK